MQRAACRSPTYPQSVRQEGRNPARRAHRRHHRSGRNDLNQGGPPKPVSLPPPQTNASWTEPGGTPSNNLGHLALTDQVQKVWSADAGTGSSSSGRLSAHAARRRRQGLHARCRRHGLGLLLGERRARVGASSVTPENEKRKEGFGGGSRSTAAVSMLRPATALSSASIPATALSLWTKTVGEPVRSSPTARGGKVFFVSADNVLHALNGGDGTELWTARGLPQVATLLSNVSPAVSADVVVAPFPAGDVAAYDVTSGKASWTRFAVAHDRDHRCRHSRRSGAPGDRQGRGVRGQSWRQDDRHLGVERRAAVDAQYRAARRCRGSLATPSMSSILAASSGRCRAPTARSDGRPTCLPAVAGAGPCLPAAGSGSCRATVSLSLPTRGAGRFSPISISAPASMSLPLWPAGRMYILSDNATLIALN